MDYEFLVDGENHTVSIDEHEGKVIATLQGKSVAVDARWLSPETVSLLIDGKSYLAHVARDGKRTLVAVGGQQFRLEEPAQAGAGSYLTNDSTQALDGSIKAPMPGLVIKVNVSEGSKVDRGDGLVVVEAMKMEHEMRAAFAATVEKVYVTAGQQVDAFQALVDLKPLEDDA